jgi:hypothetical protein
MIFDKIIIYKIKNTHPYNKIYYKIKNKYYDDLLEPNKILDLFQKYGINDINNINDINKDDNLLIIDEY